MLVCSLMYGVISGLVATRARNMSRLLVAFSSGSLSAGRGDQGRGRRGSAHLARVRRRREDRRARRHGTTKQAVVRPETWYGRAQDVGNACTYCRRSESKAKEVSSGPIG